MRIFLAGATGALGSRLVPLLVDAGPPGHGHDPLSRQGRTPCARRAPSRSSSTASTATRSSPRSSPRGPTRSCTSSPPSPAWAACATSTARSRSPTGCGPRAPTTCSPARAQAGARRFVAQSYAGWPYARGGGPVKTEDDPLDPDPVPSMSETLAAIRRLEAAVTGAGGIVLRYGGFYGPGTGMAPGRRAARAGPQAPLPVVGDGGGVWSFVHIDDAAAATLAALERGAPGAIYNVVDDDPAPVRDWLPALAGAAGAKPPRRLPRWLARLAAGEAVATLMTECRGASNAKARRELGWQPGVPELARRLPGGAGGLTASERHAHGESGCSKTVSSE